ncbi:MAG: acetamidase/formamidase family protein [Lentihominibacter sp.]
MKIIDESVLTFSKDNTPKAAIDSGEILVFRAEDCFGNAVQEELPMGHINLEYSNPAAGPVYVNGAVKGDVLKVEILAIDVDDHGVVCTFDHCGPFQDKNEVRTRILPVKEGMTAFKDVSWMTDPMVGVIGTSPAEGSIGCGFAFELGGNMDCSVITVGSTVYLPVDVDGGLLQMGDIHASMGDGELTGTGIEIQGDITVRVTLIKDFELNWPVVETEDSWYVCAADQRMEPAFRKACSELRRLVSNAYSWDDTDVALYVTLRGKMAANQACMDDDFQSVRMGIPKTPGKPGLVK